MLKLMLMGNEITIPSPNPIPYPDEADLTSLGQTEQGKFVSPSASSSPENGLPTGTSSNRIPIEYNCERTGTIRALDTAYINIVYSTGATDDVGAAILKKAVIEVTVGCKNPGVGGGNNNPGEGTSAHEPWLRMFDGEFFGFQAVGEFTLVQNPNNGFNVQARYVAGTGVEIDDNSRLSEVSFNGAVAVQAGSDQVGVYAVKGRNTCWANGCGFDYKVQAQVQVNGQIIAPPTGYSYDYAQVLPGGGVLSWYDYNVIIISPNREEIVIVRLFENHVGSVQVRVPASRKGEYIGLLGNFDDNSTNDFVSKTGTEYAMPLTAEQLYFEWGESWRLEQDESIFNYEDDLTTASFTDRSFPTRTVSLASLSAAARTLGETACRAANVLDPETFIACVLDVGLTGNPGWANVAKGVDPGSNRLIVAPLKAVTTVGERVVVNADLFGNFNSRDLIWTSDGGSIAPIAGVVGRAEFIAPMNPGAYTIRVRSAEDPNLTNTILVQVGQTVEPIINRLAVGGEFTALVNTNGTVSSWGFPISTDGQGGYRCSDGANVLVAGVSGVRSVVAGNNYAIANLFNGNIVVWGGLNYVQPQAVGSVIYPPTFISASDWVGVAPLNYSGGQSFASLRKDGSVWVWLKYYLGQYNYILKPYLVQGLNDVVGMSNGWFVKRDGTVWKTSITGNLRTYSVNAVQIMGLNNIAEIHPSSENTRFFALARDGTVWAWGNNYQGTLGLGLPDRTIFEPQQIPNLNGVTKIFGDWNHYAITSDGSLYAWGVSLNGFPFVNGTDGVITTPTRIDEVSNVIEAQTSGQTLILVKSDGSLWGWGNNYSQQVLCNNSNLVGLPTLIPGVRW